MTTPKAYPVASSLPSGAALAALLADVAASRQKHCLCVFQALRNMVRDICQQNDCCFIDGQFMARIPENEVACFSAVVQKKSDYYRVVTIPGWDIAIASCLQALGHGDVFDLDPESRDDLTISHFLFGAFTVKPDETTPV